jgi:bacillolysin
MKTLKIIIGFIILSIACYNVIAQASNKYLIKNTTENGIPVFVKFDIRSCQLTDPSDFFNEELILRNVDEFRKVYSKTRKLESGDEIKNEKYQQYYGDLKVEGGIYLIHYKNDTIYSLNGLYLDNINLNQIPKINNKIALERAMQNINAEIYNWEVYDTIYIPEGELLVIKSDTLKNSYHLAYKFIISALKPLSSYLIYVDANDGSILIKHPLFFNDFPSPGTAYTRYSGEQTIYTDMVESEEMYRLYDDERDIHTYDNNNYDGLGHQTEYLDNNNIWTVGEWNYDPGLDAHWGAYITYEYLKNIIGINSYDDENGYLNLFVHWDEEWEDAGTDPLLRYIVFGDGGTVSGTRPWASLDVVAHEIGHLISYYSGLGTLGTETMAIVEGFSDIWAISVEWNYVNNIEYDPNKDPYTGGEEICTSANFIRSFRNPNSEGLDGFKGADTYQDEYWNYDPPYSKSTVISHWYFIFNEGKTGVNYNGDDFSVEGISDPLTGSRILYNVCGDGRLEGDNITFQEVKEQIIDLMQTEYGHLDNKTLNSIQAWYAVGVPGSCLTQCLNKTYSSDFNLYVPGCNLNVKNVNITGSGTDVIFEADEITIESDFEVASGTTLEIINP